MSNGFGARLAGVAVVAILALNLLHTDIYVRAERPNQDEGWYLYAARLVRDGQRPYLDFAYVQPPALPYLYAALGAGDSVEAGRRIGAGLGTLAVLLVALAAWVAGPAAGLTAAALLAFTPFVLSQQSVVKAYALANFFQALALLLALRVGRRWAGVFLASAAFALAALARNSAAPALLAYWLWLALPPDRRRLLPAAVMGGGGVLLLALAPFLLLDAGAVYRDLIAHHAGNVPRTSPVDTVLTMWAMAGFLTQACPAVAFALVAGLTAAVAARDELAWRPEIGLCLTVAAAVYLGQFVSNHPYQEYQVLAFPAAALAAALCWGEVARLAADRRLPTIVLVTAVGLVPLVSLGPAEADLPGLRPGPDGRVELAGVHGPLRRTAELVQRHAAPDESVFTFQTAVAVEARRRLVPGLTLGAFSFTDAGDAGTRHLTNPATMTQQLAGELPAVVVVSPGDVERIFQARWVGDRLVPREGMDEALRRIYDPLVRALDEHYRVVGTVDGVGQFFEPFTVMARRRS